MTATHTPDLFDLGHVTAGGGWEPTRGFFQGAPSHIVVFATKAEAVKAARSIGWAASTVEKCYSRFSSRFYALHHARGGFLTPAGMAALRPEHRTRTLARTEGERYVSKSNGSCGRWRSEVVTGWTCTCGRGGFGEQNDRGSAQRWARLHRDDPQRFPGVPWTHGTVETAQAS